MSSCTACAEPIPDSALALDASSLPLRFVLLLAIAAACAVANVYYAQPLLDAMASTFDIDAAAIGLVGTVTLGCYGLGLVLLVPLGDVWQPRRLILGQLLFAVLALVAIGAAPNADVLFAGMAAIGFVSVVAQVIVAFAANHAAPAQRGRVVGTVTSGIVLGILLARTLSGALADLAGWRAVYFVSAALILAIAVALAKTLPKSAMRPAQREAVSTSTSTSYRHLLSSTFMLLASERVLRLRACLAFLQFAATMVLWTPMALALAAPPLALSHTAIGALGLAGAAGALGAARAGHLADRGRAQWVSGAGLAGMLFSWLPTAWGVHSVWALAVGVVVFDFGLQALHVANQSLIYHVRSGARSRVTAAYMLMYALGCAGGSIASTAVFARGGWGAVCLLGAGINLCALAFWLVVRRHEPADAPRAAS
ncbi:MFS transporter [Trinickia fusca]|uniref:MFS transporter n=1 Tax=Trinickia fusca TaxID=2419777 RepID=A0A494X3N0_9BURK|nr:MFS transporter [Trinickia fusca]RKP44950.1 MFS transporter [Trinickia fusca]